MNVLIEYVPVITAWQKITLTHNKCTITPGTIIPAGGKEEKKKIQELFEFVQLRGKEKDSVVTW